MDLLLKITEEEQILATTNLNNTCIYENKLILPLVYMIKKFTINGFVALLQYLWGHLGRLGGIFELLA